MPKINWPKDMKIEGVSEAAMKAITEMTNVTATVPIIWSKVLEQNYRQLTFMEQFAVMNTDLVGVPGDRVKISKISEIGPAADMNGGKGPTGESLYGPETQWLNTTIMETAFNSFELVELRPTKKFKAILFTKEELENAFAPRMGDATDALAYAFKLKMDMDCHAALNASVNIIGQTAWPSLVVGDVFTALGVQQAKLRYDLQVKRQPFAYFEGGTTVMLISPYQHYHLLQDVDVFDVVKRNQPAVLFKNELFTWANVRFVIDEGIPFYAGGALTEIAAFQDMMPYDNSTKPNDTWLFSTDGTWGNRQDCIAPRYQTIPAAKQHIELSLDATDTVNGPQVVMVDHHNGIVKFDIPVGGSVDPQAKFSYGTVYGYQAQMIGPRAFCIAKKYDPQLVQEIRNYGNFIGIGGAASWDVKALNPEQCVNYQTAVVPPFSMQP